MKLLSTQLGKIKNLLDTKISFLSEVAEIIHQVSGVSLTTSELVWRPPVLIIKSSAPARNLILRHREEILAHFSDHFARQSPKSIR